MIPATTDLLIRDAEGTDELRRCQQLQRRAFGIAEDGYVIPIATMTAAHRSGGLVLVALHGSEIVAFSFAFLGRVRGELVLHSQLAVVDPAFQSLGVGRAMKLEQRRRAGQAGLSAVVWTFDPLRSRNARFNLAILGAYARTYEVNLYGRRTDALNAGMATDRLVAEWPTIAERRGMDQRWEDAVEVIATRDEGARPVPDGVRAIPDTAERLHVEIPAAIDAVKEADPRAAAAWQTAVREALRTAFARGYVAVGFASGERPCYLLEREA